MTLHLPSPIPHPQYHHLSTQADTAHIFEETGGNNIHTALHAKQLLPHPVPIMRPRLIKSLQARSRECREYSGGRSMSGERSGKSNKASPDKASWNKISIQQSRSTLLQCPSPCIRTITPRNLDKQSSGRRSDRPPSTEREFSLSKMRKNSNLPENTDTFTEKTERIMEKGREQEQIDIGLHREQINKTISQNVQHKQLTTTTTFSLESPKRYKSQTTNRIQLSPAAFKLTPSLVVPTSPLD